MTLPAQVVERALPKLTHPADASLFQAELRRELPEVSTRLVSGVFFPDGWQDDYEGLKGLIKRQVQTLATRAQPWQASEGRAPLIATDRFSNGYFHWVAEVLPRLWWLRNSLSSCELALPAFATRLAYMVPSLAVFPQLSFRVLSPRERWRLTEALLVPAPAPTGNYRPELVQGLGAAWREKVGSPGLTKKLYISRAQAGRRRIKNESEVRTALEAQGFETVFLEDLSFEAQVRLMASARHVVSNHGAGLTNILFMLPGTRVTEIRREGDSHNNCFFSLAQALGLEYDYRIGRPVREREAAHTADLVVNAGDLP